MNKISCGRCDKCLERLPEQCHALIGVAPLREVELGATALKVDPKDIEHPGRGKPCFHEVDGSSEARKVWIRGVRRLIWGHGMAWWDIRDRYGNEQLRKLCLDGMSPEDAVKLILESIRIS